MCLTYFSTLAIDNNVEARSTHLYLDVDTYDRLREFADGYRVSMSRIVRGLVTSWDGQYLPTDNNNCTHIFDGEHSIKGQEAKQVNRLLQRMGKK